MIVKLYIYQKSTGEYLYTDIGNPDLIINDLGDDKDFTLTPPPNDEKGWRWVDSEWI